MVLLTVEKTIWVLLSLLVRPPWGSVKGAISTGTLFVEHAKHIVFLLSITVRNAILQTIGDKKFKLILMLRENFHKEMRTVNKAQPEYSVSDLYPYGNAYS